MSILEKNIQKEIMLELSKYGIPIRINSGTAWTGNKIKKNKDGSLTIFDPRPFKSNSIDGFPDLLFLGDNGNIAFIECKTLKGTTRDAQERFIEAMKQRNIKIGIARSVEDAINIIKRG